MKKRSCGECSACCKTHGVIEINKMPNVWCTHCKVGKGCKIYKKRPESCQRFKCSWLSGIGDDSERPDKVRVVQMYAGIAGIDGPALCLWEVEDGSLDSEYVRYLTYKTLLGGDMVLHHSTKGGYTLYGSQKMVMPVFSIKIESEMGILKEREVKFIPFIQAYSVLDK
jgi:hypothetical protein